MTTATSQGASTAGNSALGDQIVAGIVCLVNALECLPRIEATLTSLSADVRALIGATPPPTAGRMPDLVSQARTRVTPALLTLPEAATYLAIPLATLKYKIYRMCEIPSVRLPGTGDRRQRRVKKADLDRLIEQGAVPAFRRSPSPQGLPIRTREIEEKVRRRVASRVR